MDVAFSVEELYGEESQQLAGWLDIQQLSIQIVKGNLYSVLSICKKHSCTSLKFDLAFFALKLNVILINEYVS